MLKLNHLALVVLLSAGLFFGDLLHSQDQLRLAIMDFQNLSNQPDLGYLEKAIPELLITDLSLSKKIKIVERTRLEEILKELKLSLSGAVDPAKVVKVGKIAGARAILLGSIIKAGETCRIDARLTEVSTSEVLLAEKIEWASEDEVIAAIDRLAEQIIKNLTGESLPIGARPPSGRVEFPQGRPVAMETVLDNSYRLRGSDEPVYLQMELFAQEIEAEKRIPLNISVVIDRSGSMASEHKLDYVKKAAEFVVENLGVKDILSVVTYETSVQTPIGAQRAGRKELFLQTIRDITAGGSTNLSGGMLEGYAQVQRNIKAGQVNRVLLLSDGLANRGITDPKQLQNICQEKSSQGMSLSTFGVGADYNEDLMLALAEYGNGNYYFIDTPEKIPTIFSKELKGLLAVAAQNVKIEVKPHNEVTIDEVYGYLSETKQKLTTVTIGDMFSNEQKTIVIRLKVPKDYQGSLELGRVTLTYDDVIGKKGQIEETSVLSVQYTDDKKLVEANENESVGQAVSLLTSTVRMQQAIGMVDKGEIERARGFLDQDAEYVKSAAAKYQTTELKKQILNVYRYNKSLEEYEEKASEEKKLMQKKAKSEQYEIQKKK